MASNIKFPTMLTGVLETHHDRCVQMVDDVCKQVLAYSSIPADQKYVYKYRGRDRTKVIKNISTSTYNIGSTPVVELKIDEYKCGLTDMYLDEGNQNPRDISDTDKLGSRYNYALLYPFIQDTDNGYTNRWLVVIYDTPDKMSDDIVNTVKCVVGQILKFPFRYIIPRDFIEGSIVPKIEVQFSNLENGENQNVTLHNYVVSNRIKKQKTITYEDVPVDDVSELVNEDRSGWKKKIVRIFKNKENNKAYQKYVFDTADDGALRQAYAVKYSYVYPIEEGDNVSDDMFRRRCFTEVIENYLSNGRD